IYFFFFFFQAEDGIRDFHVTGVQTCALPILTPEWRPGQGHNGYIDTYVELGLVGLGLLLIVIFVAFSGALNDLQVNFDLGSLRRSEERRVGKECRSLWWRDRLKNRMRV